MPTVNALKLHIYNALTQPPHVVVKKTAAKMYRLLMKHRDSYLPSYADLPPKGSLYRYFPTLDAAHLKPVATTLRGIAQRHLEHRFNLLGSGWVQVRYGMQCRGLAGYCYDMGRRVRVDGRGKWLTGRINNANLRQSQRIWRLVDMDYIPIDWHLDFKSGYRWSERAWYKDIAYGHIPGADIKVPWELSRMQHLPQLALAYGLATHSESGFAEPEVYLREFRNQVLDFVSTNPPRFGANWACTMDVGIRVANWLVAYDLFNAFGAEFDSKFEEVFAGSVSDHGLHIVNNLEWTSDLRSNHYLADIVGLLFVAAYLERCPEIDVWLAFAVQELLAEVPRQFYEDGANFEASTSYHRLAAETVAYATSLVLGLPRSKQAALQTYNHRHHRVHPRLVPAPVPLYPLPGGRYQSPFPTWYFERLEKMAEFTMHITRPNGQIPQIGDNDSGRFLRLHPAYQGITVAEAKARYLNLDGYDDLPDDAAFWDEDYLDHRSLVATVNGLFGRNDFTEFSNGNRLETYLIKALVDDLRIPSYRQSDQPTYAELVRVGGRATPSGFCTKLGAIPEKSKKALEIQIPGGGGRECLKLYGYPHFGLYIYCSKRLYLALRCGPIGQNDLGGHAHNDQLSLELCIDGLDRIRDLGTYVYTPLPLRRNQYRSVAAHFAPQLPECEPASLDLGLFRLGDESRSVCLYFGEEGFVGMNYYNNAFAVYRIVLVLEESLRIIDYAEGNAPLKDIYQINSDGPGTIPFSPGYGLLNA